MILPPDDDSAELAANKTWRIIFAFCSIPYTLMLIGLYTVVTIESPKFYITNKKD